MYCTVGPRYKLEAHVGSGSYGDVCRAMDLEFGQIVALKVNTRPFFFVKECLSLRGSFFF